MGARGCNEPKKKSLLVNLLWLEHLLFIILEAEGKRRSSSCCLIKTCSKFGYRHLEFLGGWPSKRNPPQKSYLRDVELMSGFLFLQTYFKAFFFFLLPDERSTSPVASLEMKMRNAWEGCSGRRGLCGEDYALASTLAAAPGPLSTPRFSIFQAIVLFRASNLTFPVKFHLLRDWNVFPFLRTPSGLDLQYLESCKCW